MSIIKKHVKKIFLDEDFGGKLYCIEGYSERKNNWGLAIFQSDHCTVPCIYTEIEDGIEWYHEIVKMYNGADERPSFRVARYVRDSK